MNPRWMLFSAIRACDLMRLDWTDADTMARPDPPGLSGWCIHSQIHAMNPVAKDILHIHPPHATALAGLADPTPGLQDPARLAVHRPKRGAIRRGHAAGR